jgi:hypothetical protein
MHQAKQSFSDISKDLPPGFDLFRLFLGLFLINANLINQQNLKLIRLPKCEERGVKARRLWKIVDRR